MAPYEHPYRYAAVQTWRHQVQLRWATALAVVLWAAGAAGVAAGEELLGLLGGVGAMLLTIVVVLWVIAILRTGYRLLAGWRRETDSPAVRAHRPQAGTEDPDLLHDEFAVVVSDDGHLVTWRFRPLRVSEPPADLEIEVFGRPRYALPSTPVEETPFDIHDTVLASEQLVMAQTAAAERESAAAEAAHAALEADHEHAELAAEARTTAAALRRATGQRGD